MKQIETREERERKTERNKRIASIIIGGILLLSIVAYGFSLFLGNDSNSNSGSSEKVNYRGLDFNQQGGFWQTQISGYNFYFTYLPNETLEFDNSVTRKLNSYYSKPLYFVGSEEAKNEIDINLLQFVQRITPACISNLSCSGDLPVKSCLDNMVIIEPGSNSIVEKENCTFIYSNETVKAIDSFLYRLLQIA